MTARVWFWALVSALLAALALTTLWSASFNQDAAWYLHVIEVLRRGGHLYRDVVDTNPPLIIYLMWPAVWLARIASIGDTTAYLIYASAMALASAAGSAWLARRVWPRVSGEALGVFIASLVFALLPFVRADFGQREHLAVLLTLPYVLWAAMPCPFADAGDVRRHLPLRVVIGALAGLGFSLKPHFAAAWVAVECSVWLETRRLRAWLRPEVIATGVVMAAYGLFVIVRVPEYLAVAREALSTYGGLDATTATLIRLPDVSMWVAAAALLAFVRLSAGTTRPVHVLFAAATGYLIAALLQRKGWSYQMYPFRAFAIMFFVALAIAIFETAPALVALLRGGIRTAALVFAAALTISSVRDSAEVRHPATPDLVSPLVSLIKARAPAGPLAVLSMRTIIYPAFPAVNLTGAAWSMRQNALWFLPGLYAGDLAQPDAEERFRTPAQMGPLERRWFDETVDDLCRLPPRLLLIETPNPRAAAGRQTLDLAAYYRQDPRFDRLFASYSPLDPIGPFAVYFAASAPASCAAR